MAADHGLCDTCGHRSPLSPRGRILPHLRRHVRQGTYAAVVYTKQEPCDGARELPQRCEEGKVATAHTETGPFMCEDGHILPHGLLLIVPATT